MSRSRGKVEFTGLRFLLQATGERLTRKQLVSRIRHAFASRGLVFPFKLRVEFRMTRKPRSVIDGTVQSVWGLMYHRQNRIVVYVYDRLNGRTNLPSVLGTLGHELDHVFWEMQGKQFEDNLPYLERPYEIRARKTGAKWQQWAQDQLR